MTHDESAELCTHFMAFLWVCSFVDSQSVARGSRTVLFSATWCLSSTDLLAESDVTPV